MSTPLVMLLLLLTCTSGASSAKVKSIFILAGQSNMSGRGGVYGGVWDQKVPGKCYPNPNVLRYTSSRGWEQAREPLHDDYEGYVGIGPGLAFANTVLEKNPSLAVVGLLPCAVGGSPITEWAKGSSYFTSTVGRTAAALGDGGSLKALLWFQGESDSNDAASAAMYKDRLTAFFTDFRAAIGDPTLPIIQVAIATGGGYREQVRQAQKSIGLSNVKTVDAAGLGLEQDGVHLSSEGAAQLGSMMAGAYLSG